MKKIHHFIGEHNRQGSSVTITDAELCNQIRNVLRLESGEHIVLGDGSGERMEIVLDTVTSRLITGTVVSDVSNDTSSRLVVLYAAIIKSDHFELIAQKATELGVTSIVPIVTARTIKKEVRLERLEKIVKEAAEQSERATVPSIVSPISFSSSLERGGFILDRSGAHTLRKALAGASAGQVSLCIGPEGGFTDQEIAEATRAGLIPVTLGSTILRAETAAIVAVHEAVSA